MSLSFKKIAGDKLQPSDFTFSKKNLKIANSIMKRYPKNYPERSLMPLLTLAQKQNQGWIPKKAIEYIANFLKVSVDNPETVITSPTTKSCG